LYVRFNGGASSVVVYGNHTPSKVFSDKKTECKRLGFEERIDGSKGGKL